MAKKKRRDRPTGSDPPIFREPPRGFTLRWLNKPDDPILTGDGDRLGLLLRNLPPNWERHTGSLRHAAVSHFRRGDAPEDRLSGPLWYPLHWAWDNHPEKGVVPVLVTEARDAGLEDALGGGVGIVVQTVPAGRQPVSWDKPHVVLALFPDGEFVRILATAFMGPVQIAVDSVGGTKVVPVSPVPPASINPLADPEAKHPVCDFCSLPDPTWRVPCPSFSVVLPGVGAVNMNDGWAACQDCADFVTRDDASGLVHRAVNAWYRMRIPAGLTGLTRVQRESYTRQAHTGFWVHYRRTGSPKPVAYVGGVDNAPQRPISVGIEGHLLDNGAPALDQWGQPTSEDGVLLLDPVCVVGDYGEIVRQDQAGRYQFDAGTLPTGLYHPDDYREYLSTSHVSYLDLWRGTVPGFAGRVGYFKTLLEKRTAEAAQRATPAPNKPVPAETPTNLVYAQALERKLEALRWVRAVRPFTKVKHLHHGHQGIAEDQEEMDSRLIAILTAAHPVFWTADMLTVLEGLEPGLQKWTVDDRDFAHPTGYVWFERALPILPGDIEVQTGYAWHLLQHNGEMGYIVVPFTRYDGVPREAKVADLTPPYCGGPRRIMFWKLGTTLDQYLGEIKALYDDADWAAHASRVSGIPAANDHRQMVRWARIFATSIVLMNQRLTRLGKFRTDRHGRKRAQEALHLPPDAEAPSIVAVMMRRVDYLNRHPTAKGETQVVNWSHRWLVSRHLRNQYFPSENRHKNIWIEMYEKGPADKPLWVPKDGSVDVVGR